MIPHILGKVDKGLVGVERGGKDVVTFDLEGRLIYYTTDGKTYRRSLENRFIRLAWEGKKRIVEEIKENESNKIVDSAYSLAADLSSKVDDPKLAEALEKVGTKNWNWLVEDSKKMHSIYNNSIPIIPPDQYYSIYLQLTKGCAWNKCTFCKLYQDRQYSVKDLESFKDHVKRIKDFFGEGLHSRRGLFLGDANAINVDQKLLIDALDVVKNEFHLPVYSFIDAFTTPKKKNLRHFEEMKRHGLTRVYIGLESGSPKVLRLLNKLMNVSEILNLVNNLKAAGIGVGIILMVGAGGYKFEKEHIEDTANVISQMDLGIGDIIYLSPLFEYDDLEYHKITKEQGIGILTDEEKADQIDRLSNKIKDAYLETNGRALEIPVSKYDLRESIY